MVTGTGNRNSPIQGQKESLHKIKDVDMASPISNAKATYVEEHKWNAQMTNNEYEAIKERVTALESRLSAEFTKLRSSISNTSIDSDDVLSQHSGPVCVLKEFERTKEETGMMNISPMTEQLTKRLSRGLNIRSSGGVKVCRSPSARKIGSIRRRSQENACLTRTKSWHLGPSTQSPSLNTVRPTRVTRNSPLQPLSVTSCSPVLRNTQTSRVNLKRGKPNTSQNGLRSTQKLDINKYVVKHADVAIEEDVVNEVIRTSDFDADIQNENWVCADIFFDELANPKDIEDTTLTSSTNCTRLSMTRAKPARKLVDGTPTQTETNLSTNGTARTPMLPPRLPIVKKTPSKIPLQSLSTCRNLFTPLLQQTDQAAGRASIARLRNQNAGMVMAKAKLFDDLVNDEPVTKRIQQINSYPHTDSYNQTCVSRNLPRQSGSPRYGKSIGMNGVQRRQQRTTIKNELYSADKTPLTCQAPSRIGRSIRSSALEVTAESPVARCKTTIIASPNSLRQSVTKPPRRIIRTAQKKCSN